MEQIAAHHPAPVVFHHHARMGSTRTVTAITNVRLQRLHSAIGPWLCMLYPERRRQARWRVAQEPFPPLLRLSPQHPS